MKSDKAIIGIVAQMLSAKEHLDLVFSRDPQNHMGYEAHVFSKIFELGDDFVLINDGEYSGWVAKAEVMVSYAQVYAGAYDIAIKVCRCHLHRDLPLPEPMRLFAAEVLAGEVPRPKKVIGKSRERNWMRNEMIVRYMEMLTGPYFEYSPTRNYASATLCAADILAYALNECGYAMITSDTVLNIWKDKKFRNELAALRSR